MTAQDKELFSQLYDRNYKRLLYAAIRIAHNPFTAEELTNEAFTILLTHFDRVRQHRNLPGWLHTVLTNLALDEYKRQKPVCAGAAGQRSESWLRTGVPFYARPAAE
ncbi:MAG: RNA polymerase sigma factor [Butyricicoccus sp.]